jgi:hypothetical protein
MTEMSNEEEREQQSNFLKAARSYYLHQLQHQYSPDYFLIAITKPKRAMKKRGNNNPIFKTLLSSSTSTSILP